MDSLCLKDGRIIKNPKRITMECQCFYQELYTAQAHTPMVIQATQEILKDCNSHLQATTALLLDECLSEQEIKMGLKQTPAWKAPRPDGLPGAFYKKFAHLLMPMLCRLFNKIFLCGYIPRSFQETIIILLYKKGNCCMLSNWRPISLLNVDGKIFTNILNAHIQSTLPEIIHPDQKGFVKGRSIMEHVYTMESYIDTANTFKSPLIITFLDQAKAYDRVEWPYLMETL